MLLSVAVRFSSAVETSARWLPAVLLMAVALVLAVSTPLVSPDSAYYLDTARQLAEGHGAVTYALHLGMPAVPTPAGFWPTLYPQLLRVVMAIGVPAGRAPAVLNGASFVALCFVLVRIARRCVPARWVWPLVLLGVAHPSYLYVLHFAWSEALFMVFVYAGLAVLLDIERADTAPLKRCAVAGALGGAAFATRYAGMFFLGYLVTVLVVVAVRKRWKPASLACAVAVAVGAFALPAVPAILPNLRVYGSAFGMPRLAVASLSQAALARGEDIAITGGTMWLYALAVLAVAMLLVSRTADASDDDRPTHDGSAWLLGGWVVFYTCALFVSLVPYVRSEHLDDRFFAPVAPATVLAVMVWLARRRPRVHPATTVLASLVAAGLFAYTGWRDRPGDDAPDPVATWALEHRGEDSVFVGAELWSLRDQTGVVVLTDGYPEMPALGPAPVRDFLGRQGARFRRAHLVFGGEGTMKPAFAAAYTRALGDVGFLLRHTDRLADGSVVVTLER